MRNASQEDCKLLAESEILQRDLFVAAKDQKDHPKKREDCVQHEAGSVSASSLKINRLRDRCDLARHSLQQPMHLVLRVDVWTTVRLLSLLLKTAIECDGFD